MHKNKADKKITNYKLHISKIKKYRDSKNPSDEIMNWLNGYFDVDNKKIEKRLFLMSINKTNDI